MGWVKAILGAIKAFFLLKVYQAGKTKVENEVNENTIEDIREAAEIHDRVDSDPDYRKRVQDEFTER